MTPDKDAEIARLRRELEVALEAARVNGEERNELARQLGAEVAANIKLRETLRYAKANVKPGAIWCLAAIDAALASGNGDGGGK